MIKINDLKYSYKIFHKNKGIKGSINDLFNRKYIEKSALEDINLNIKKGEIVSVIGRNGAGKTTLIKLMCGLLENEGNIKINSHNPYEKKIEFLKKIGFVFGHKSQLLWDLPAVDSIIMQKEIYRIEKNEFEKRIKYYSELFEVTELLTIPVRKLSLGERIKLEIICSIIYEPELLFLDEPTLGLDLLAQNSLYKALKELNQKKNITIILTSHNISDIKMLASRIVYLQNKKIVYDMALDKFIKKFNKNKGIEITSSNSIISVYNSEKIEGNTYLFPYKNESEMEIILKDILEKNKGITSIKTMEIELEKVILELMSDKNV